MNVREIGIPVEVIIKADSGNIKKIGNVNVQIWKDGTVEIKQINPLNFVIGVMEGIYIQYPDDEPYEKSKSNEILSCKIML